MSPAQVIGEEIEAFDEEEMEDLDAPQEQQDQPGDKPKRERFILHKDNVYLFDTEEACKEHLSSKKLKYQTSTKDVEGFRSWRIVKEPVWQEGTNKLTNPEATVCFVLARNNDQASRLFLEKKLNYIPVLGIHKRRGGGPGKRKIEEVMRGYGMVLEMGIQLQTDPETKTQLKADFQNLFGPRGKYSHYRDENNAWKAVTPTETRTPRK